MPEYLAPGVYVEETSFRSKSIEGVSTSTAGFVGPARFGPVSGDPELITSLEDFRRWFGGLDDLTFDGAAGQITQPNYLAQAVRAYFEEGGKRLYVSRVFDYGDGYQVDEGGLPVGHYGIADFPDPGPGEALSPPVGSPPDPPLRLVARFPGAAGNLRATFTLRVGGNGLVRTPAGGATPVSRQLTRVREFDVVFVARPVLASPPSTRVTGWTAASGDGLFLARRDPTGAWVFSGAGGNLPLTDALFDDAQVQVQPLSVVVEVQRPNVRTAGFTSPETLGDFTFDPRGATSLFNTFTRNPTIREAALTSPFSIELPAGVGQDQQALYLVRNLLDDALTTLAATATPRPVTYTFDGGDDGALPAAAAYAGDPDFRDFSGDPLQMPKNGLLALEGQEDISIVAAPGYSEPYQTEDQRTRVEAVHGAVISHCERMRYRIAVLDTPRRQLVSGALEFRNRRSSDYAALYYPWVTIANPLDGQRLDLPPSGFIAGIYARNDVEHAVFKAPANEVVRLAIDFEQKLNKERQEALNPEGVNCFRFFEGRGHLVWGARTISDDPEWKYVNLRRYFAYLERSIDRGTQWVVFENNGPQLWDNVRRTVEDFLFNEWRMGGLLGDKPEQAYFVRCDRSTMTQNDLDNGRLVCLVGVAPVRPAEFVIFRIGQWTATTTAR